MVQNAAMGSLPPWIRIPRSDLTAHDSYRLPLAFRVTLGAGALFFLALFVGALWTALHESSSETRISMFFIAVFFGAFLAYLLSIVATFGDRIETTPEELRLVRTWSRSAIALPWSRVESLRVRPVLKRIEVGSSALRRPIHLELQLARIEDLLMFVAERTFHLHSPGPAQEPAKKVKRVRWSVGADGLESFPQRIGFGEVADLRILRIGAGVSLALAVAAQLRGGSWVPVHVGTEGAFDFYWRARRAHRDWLARSDATALAPIAALLPQRVSGARSWLAALIPMVTTIALVVGSAVLRDRQPVSRSEEGRPQQAAIGRAVELFRAHRYPDLVALAEKHFARNEPSPENLLLLHLQAASYRKLDRRLEAVETYERGVSVVRTLDNVHAEPFAVLLYELATLYDAEGDIRRAITVLEEGLKLRPGSAMHRALLAAWYQDLGDAGKAESLFREVLESAPEGSEPHAVAERRLATGAAVSPRSYLEFAPVTADLTRHLVIAVVPLNDIDPRVDLAGICLVIEAELWIPCGVVPPSHFPEALLLDSERNQYLAGRVLAALGSAEISIARGPLEPDGGIFVLGVTSHDLFDADTNFVFSSSNVEHRVGILSSYRLLDDLPRYWAAEGLAGRRLSIQALSTVGTGLGFQRPISERCPLAYPNGVEAFVLKRGELCASEARERDAYLAGLGSRRMQPDAVRSAAIARTRHAYLLDRLDLD
jgi:predicted Zn-dependent protease